MPGSDASQFIQMKKALAVQRNIVRNDMKSINHLTQYTPDLSSVNTQQEFLPSLTSKTSYPLTRFGINVDFSGKKHGQLQKCG